MAARNAENNNEFANFHCHKSNYQDRCYQFLQISDSCKQIPASMKLQSIWISISFARLFHDSYYGYQLFWEAVIWHQMDFCMLE